MSCKGYNQTMPVGPPGPTGPAGANGSNGSNGTNGTNGTTNLFSLISDVIPTFPGLNIFTGYSYTLPADKLAVDKDALEVEFQIHNLGTASAVVRLYANATQILDRNLPDNNGCLVKARIVRTGATTIKIEYSYTVGPIILGLIYSNTTFAVSDSSNYVVNDLDTLTNVFTLQGNASVTGLTAKYMTIDLIKV